MAETNKGRDGRNFRIISDSVRRKTFENKAMKSSIRYRVLYAEDNEDACDMLTALLGFSGIDVLCAYTVKEAFQQAQNERFDVYLLDSRFPDGDGLELCRQLRELHPQIPIVFYSSNAYETDRQAGLAAGAQAYLVKPEVETLVPTILRLVSMASETVKIQGSDEFSVNRSDRQMSISPNAC
jgi:CheY-like chemotaxis protein